MNMFPAHNNFISRISIGLQLYISASGQSEDRVKWHCRKARTWAGQRYSRGKVI